MSGKLVLVTGVTGFIAGHVANQLLDAGYRVRGTARRNKLETLRETVKITGLEFVQVDDVATTDFTEALEGVHAIIHTASPIPGRAGYEDVLSSAIEGTLNVLRAATKAGIDRVVVTGTFGSLLDPDMSGAFSGRTIGDDSWGHTTREDVARNQENPVYVYFASKLLAEKSLWSYVQEEEHSNIDAITILPAFVYGPFAEHFPLPGHGALSSNNFIYELMNGTQPMVIPPAVVDVRDVAKAHVAALDLHRAPPGFVRRYIACSGNLTWGEAGDHLRQVRPDYQTLDNYVDLPGPALRLDTTRTVADLNLQWIDPRKTIVDAADALNEARKTWA